MGCVASIGVARLATANVGPEPMSPTVSIVPTETQQRKQTLKHTPSGESEPLKVLQVMILEMGRTGKIELTSTVVREGAGGEPGTLTKQQIPRLQQVPGIILGMVHLRELCLRCNQIQEIPREIGQLEALQVLDISENQLIELPSELTTLSNLRVLEVGENYLKTLPESIGGLVKLESLRANRNKLKEFPDGIRSCRKLKLINLYNNGITTLNEGIAELSELEEVTVSNNVLVSLPSMSNWRKIKRLYLQVNKLQALPPLDDLKELELLQAHQNVLRELPSMTNLLRIAKIDVNNNQIREIPASIQYMPLLTHLNVRKNRVSSIPAFLGVCRNMEILDFGNNPLASPIPSGIGMLTNLKTLLLDGTVVNTLPIDLMALQNVIRVHVGNCIQMDDQETAEVVLELRARCKVNGGWLKSG
ncbi:hypothetical protein Poli38472_007421 [Pythium oligandrum]|uniref:Disease resistance R13L4/SHOC-2-like LRR domain-containing protein n=1 Tax=Pythium oligandrum TaxID=41045 RepID=A0A8K1CQH0_PYTOL|nr:hypothetical protein Poli38472_007421 [Pythium oligandrum]|eukprot:TMW67749.1 hypothetical protein Poli38472_007421 [Pythium oligandrum]